VKFPEMDKNYQEERDNNNFFQSVPILRYSLSENDPLSVITEINNSKSQANFKYKEEYRFLEKSSANIEIDAPVVFAGYGISNNKNAYNDYKGIDVKGKIVFILSGFPGYKDTNSIAFKSNNIKNIMEFEKDKVKTAKEKGAIAVLWLRNNPEDWLVPNNIYRFNNEEYEGDTKRVISEYELVEDNILNNHIPVIYISTNIANELCKCTNTNIADFENLVSNNLKPASGILKGKSIHFKISTKKEMIKSNNIIAYIPGEISNEYVVVGAHYDHIGKNNGNIYNGADDNASGVIAVLSIARAFIAKGVQPKRSVIFALWTGEENGLLGSKFFMNNWGTNKIDSYFNFDMISRYSEYDTTNHLEIAYNDSLEKVVKTIDQINKNEKFKLKINYLQQAEVDEEDTDYFYFANKNIPFYGFHTGLHADYHKFADHSDKANYEALTKIINLGFLTIWQETNDME
jgi:hypothetical protein